MSGNLSRVRWGILLSIFGFCLFFSCTDSVWDEQNPFPRTGKKKSKYKNEELTLSAAQQWYQEHYAPVVTTRSGVTDSTELMMKPYWEKGTEMHRGRYEVVEIPIRTKGKYLFLDSETARNWDPNAPSKFIRNTAKMVIEHDKKTGRMRSFVMIFVGSYKYLSETRTMGKNTYLYRQPDFDGMVLFYELNGTLVNGWKYTNGKITGSISPKIMLDNAVPKDAHTRVWVEECYTDLIYIPHEECEDEVTIEYDKEFGESWVVTHHCWDNGTWEFIEICNEYEQPDENNGDDNWEEDYPDGGSNTPPPPPIDEVLPPLVNPKVPIELMDKSKFVGWHEGANCLTLAQETLKKYGITNYGSSANVFRLVEEKNGQLIKWGNDPYNNYENAIKCIDDHLNAKRPIIVGVNHTLGLSDNEGTTDHFVVITGRGFDPLLRQPYYTFMDNGSVLATDGCSDMNRFYYIEGNNFSGTSEYIKAKHRSYTVVQVRPNNGQKYETTTAYKQ